MQNKEILRRVKLFEKYNASIT